MTMPPIHPVFPDGATYSTHPPECGASVAHYFRQVAISRRRQARWIDRCWRRNRKLSLLATWKP